MASFEECVLPVHGMACSGCEGRIERHLQKREGVRQVKASHTGNTVRVLYDRERASVAELETAIQTLGYEVPR